MANLPMRQNANAKGPSVCPSCALPKTVGGRPGCTCPQMKQRGTNDPTGDGGALGNAMSGSPDASSAMGGTAYRVK